MKSPKALIMATASAAALSMGLVACGGGEESTNNTGSGGGSAVKFDQASTGVVNPSDKKGGTLRFASSADFDSADPGNQYYAFALNFSRLYVRTLMTYASKPGPEAAKFTPDLAE